MQRNWLTKWVVFLLSCKLLLGMAGNCFAGQDSGSKNDGEKTNLLSLQKETNNLKRQSLELARDLIIVEEQYSKKPTINTQDLYYDKVVTDFNQGQHFLGAARVLAGQKMQRLNKYRDSSTALLGQMLLSNKLYDEAIYVLKALLNPKVDMQLRNQAWFYLAKIAYQRSDYNSAIKMLERMQNLESQDKQAERNNLYALVLLAQRKHDKAIGFIKRNSKSTAREWQAYLDFNLGVTEIYSGDTEQGIKYLAKVGVVNANTKEMQAIRDKANLTLGNYLLKVRQPKRALRYLKKVGSEGFSANKALLFAGRSAAAQQRYSQALSLWSYLLERDTAEQAVQEALLAVPYTYFTMGDYQKAADFYRYALDQYKQQDENIDDLLAMANSKQGLKKILLTLLAINNSKWLDGVNQEEMAVYMKYMSELFFMEGFQPVVDQYSELLFLQKYWQRVLAKNNNVGRNRQRVTELYKQLNHIANKYSILIKERVLLVFNKEKSDLAKYVSQANLELTRSQLFLAKQ